MSDTQEGEQFCMGGGSGRCRGGGWGGGGGGGGGGGRWKGTKIDNSIIRDLDIILLPSLSSSLQCKHTHYSHNTSLLCVFSVSSTYFDNIID